MWTKNKKYIFYSVYMEIKIPICCIALLYKSKLCLWLFFFKSNLFYSILSFASPLKLKCCTLKHEKSVGCDFLHRTHIHKHLISRHENMEKIIRYKKCMSKTVLKKHKPYNIQALTIREQFTGLHRRKKTAHTLSI